MPTTESTMAPLVRWLFPFTSRWLSLLCIFFTSQLALGFTVVEPIHAARTPLSVACSALDARRHRPINDDDKRNDDEKRIIAQLPAIGLTSYASMPPTSSDQQQHQSSFRAFVAPKFELQYTCGICNARNKHRVSRLAYRNGVVIATCHDCQSRHLIADNLGWTNYKGGFEGDTNTIEEFVAQRGDTVHRVSRTVFDLEMALQRNDGSVISGEENSPPSLE
jgi:protein import protein ZIM17